jgi:glucosamine--fructose-6-phosphate aminotransferase (isomerizing)
VSLPAISSKLARHNQTNMCGIAGYIGPRDAVAIVFDQITRLEYRGYDSAGVAFEAEGGIGILKRAGKLANLKELLERDKPTAHIAIAHSRWATHGGPTDDNAHPHFDQSDRIAVIHNGIIENYYELSAELAERGHKFESETDTEIAAHVIGEEYNRTGSIVQAVRNAVAKLKGAYALVVMCLEEPDKIVAVRNASPLILGIGQGENFLASDIPALLPYTRDVIAMEEGDLAVISREGIQIESADGKAKEPKVIHIDWDIESAEKGGFAHYMIKEIHEQPESIRQCLSGRLRPDGSVHLPATFSDEEWRSFERVIMVACGTAYHAALLGATMLEGALRIPVDVAFASEFRYGDPILRPTDLVILVSQSGETADTLAALKLCRERKIKTLGIVNVVGSSIARDCDAVLYIQAGPEISVASTKAYSAQVATLALVTLHAGSLRGAETPLLRSLASDLGCLPRYFEQCLHLDNLCQEIAKAIRDTILVFYLGRGADAPVALEGALKMKEVAYIPTQESPAGEMKHGPLALVEPGVVAVFGSTNPQLRDKVISNIKEVKARRGTVIAIAPEGDAATAREADYTIPIPAIENPVIAAAVSVLPMQLLAYHVAHLRGCEIDQPRNLAKSVTVE